ncbi:MAG: hypothetical protein Q8P41_28575 [Pseudomonadota bacterium]|nr:hypothetical protein [Pseudomonadota bacterium]
MQRRLVVLTFVALALTFGSWVLLRRPPVKEVDGAERHARAVDLVLSSVSKDGSVQTLMEESDRVTAQLKEEGEADVSDAIRRRLREARVSEPDIRSFVEANAEVFQGRPLREVRDDALKLLQIHRVRQGLGIQEPGGRLVYPN